MDKKTLTIIILSLVIICLLVWTFGFREPDYKGIENRLDSSLGRTSSILRSAGILQSGIKKSYIELEKERDISAGLQESSDYFEQKYKESESYNREQREIIDRLTSGSVESDKSIGRLESRLNRIKGNIGRLEEIGNENTTSE